jgi:hypothetical protein
MSEDDARYLARDGKMTVSGEFEGTLYLSINTTFFLRKNREKPVTIVANCYPPIKPCM